MIGPNAKELIGILESAPMRPPQYRLWFLSTGGTFLDGFSIFVLGVALPLVSDRFQLSSGMVGLISAALILGAVIGASIGGAASDRLGRKPLLLVSMTLVGLASVACVFVGGPYGLFAAQLVIGIGVGIDFPVAASYVSEIVPARSRARMMVATITFQSIGMLVGAAVCIAALHVLDRTSAWRVFFGCEAVLAAALLAGRAFMPESPRWYLGHGRGSEAGTVIARLVPADRSTIERLAREVDRDARPTGTRTRVGRPPGVAALFERKNLKKTVLASVPWQLMDIATYGVGLFTPVLLAAMHGSKPTGGPIAADLATSKGSGLIDVFLLVGFVVGMFVVPRIGRIRAQLIGFVGMVLGMVVLYVATRLPGGPSAHVALVFAGFITFNLLMNIGPNSTTFSLPPELFSTRLRATASGFAASFAKLGATVGVFVLPIVKARYGVPAVLMLMAIVSALGFVVTLVFGRGQEEPVALHEQEPAAAA